jgi:thiol-disulfide isomerase/thioredoxin
MTVQSTRRTFLLGSLALAVTALMPGCAGGNQPAAPLPSVDLAAFPAGLGRGYPLVKLEGVDNAATGARAGDTVPNFRMQLESGEGLYLHDLMGRPLLINFWATWCGPCRLEMPDIVRQSAAQPDLVVVAVNVQEKLDQIAPFAEDFNMQLPIARDADGALSNLFEVRGMPTTYFVDRQGKITTVWAGVLTPTKLEDFLAPIL